MANIATQITEAIDDDTLAAVQALWATNQDLAKLFPQPPQYGRLKPPQSPPDVSAPYAELGCQFQSRRMVNTGGAFFDYRKVTITVRGLKADVVKALTFIAATFNRVAVLVYPSGAKFMRWLPSGRDKLSQDPKTKSGQDVWIGIHEAEVWSTRTN
jgi:hypothetical protein